MRTLFNRKCGNSDFRARRDDVKCEKSFAYKNLCLNVRSATANKKKNRNANEKRNTKSINSTDFCHVDSPNANRSVCSYENDVRSNSNAGISKKLISFDSDELITACRMDQKNQLKIVLESKSFSEFTSQRRQKAGTNDKTRLNTRPIYT